MNRRRKETSRRVGFIVTGLAIVLGVVFGTWAAIEFKRSVASANWPTVEGAVTNWHPGARSSTVSIYYKYEVDGRTYHGDRVSYRPFSGLFSSQKLLKEYPEGKVVTVHYNPDNPEVAILEPGFRAGTLVVFAGSIGVILVAVFALRHGLTLSELVELVK